MKRIMLSDGEDLRIEDDGTFYIQTDDGTALIEVDLDEFKKHLIEMKNVCMNSWCKELKQQYLEVVEEVKKYDR